MNPIIECKVCGFQVFRTDTGVLPGPQADGAYVPYHPGPDGTTPCLSSGEPGMEIIVEPIDPEEGEP